MFFCGLKLIAGGLPFVSTFSVLPMDSGRLASGIVITVDLIVNISRSYDDDDDDDDDEDDEGDTGN